MTSETWWVIRLRTTDSRGDAYFTYLRCVNGYQVRRRRTRRGRRVPRKWKMNDWKSIAYPFESLVEARRNVKCSVIQKGLKRGYDMVEIVRCEGDRNKENFAMVVEERPGVDALIQLAMEAE